MPDDPLIGRTVVGHRIEALIGEGGMGVVYRARHLQLGKVRALKLLPPQLARDRDFRDRFENEWRLAAAIEHPNIVEVLDAGEADDHLYILMRLIEGADLAALVRSEGCLPAERVYRIVAQIAAALDAAHSQGLVHRDVTPRNIIVANDDRAYLADFGVARTTATRGMTRTGFFVGNLDYAAPEQIEGKTIDGRVDVYALGGVIFTCLTGEAPYVRDSDVQLMYAQLQDRPPIPSSVQPHLPPQLDPVVAKAMAKSRDDRYETCGQLAAALAEAISSVGEAVQLDGAGPSAGEGATHASTVPGPTVVGLAPTVIEQLPESVSGAQDVSDVGQTVTPSVAIQSPPASATSQEASRRPAAAVVLAFGKRRLSRKLVAGALVLLALAGATLAAVGVISSSSSVKAPHGTWTATKPVGKGVYSQLEYAQCNGADNCYADGLSKVGNQFPQKFIEKWNGQTWTSSNSPFGPNSDSIAVGELDCLPDGFCVVPISTPSLSIDSVTNGHWAAMPIDGPLNSATGAAAANGTVESVSCFSDSHCVAIGTVANSRGTSAYGLGLIWNGRIWKSTLIAHQGHDPIQNMVSVSCTSETFCMGVGYTQAGPNASRNTAIAARWDGATWTALPPPGGSRLDDVVCLSATSCIAIGADRRAALVVRWTGRTFVKEHNPLTGEGFTINCSSKNLCMALQQPPANKPLGTVPAAIRWHAHWFPLTGYPAPAAFLSGVSCYDTGCMVVGQARSTPSKNGNDINGAQTTAALYHITGH